MTDPAPFPVGSIVTHVTKTDWGPGKIVKIERDLVHVIWRDRPGNEALLMTSKGVMLASDQHDQVLDNLPALVTRNGKLCLPKMRFTCQQATEKFLKAFSAGFKDPDYLQNERRYKWVAHEDFVKNLGNQSFRQLLASDVQTLVKKVEACISKVNLLSLFEQAAFRDALRNDEAAVSFLSRLADLLEAPEITEQVYAPYARAVCDLPAERGRVATWPVATILPFLAQPDRHMFLKPEVTNAAADALGFQLNYRPEPNWLTYKCLLRMSAMYEVTVTELHPSDLIDIQSFFWVLGGGYS